MFGTPFPKLKWRKLKAEIVSAFRFPLSAFKNNFAGVAKAPRPMTKSARAVIDGLRGTMKSLLGALVLMGCVGTSFGDSLPGKLKIVTERDGEVTRVFVKNSDTIDMTSTIEVGAENMESSVPLPCTLTVPAGKTVEAFALKPTNEHWSFQYTNHFTVGACHVQHDDSYLYALPYSAGASFKVTQGYHGSFSHTGPDEFATDWKMPEGTPVLAAREGIVVSVKDNFDKGGANRKFEECANIVVIQHEDGTMAHYCHLARHSAKVRVGQKVRVGDLLAASGNTGFTSGPHLHFAVFRARDGHGRETIPVKFRTSDGTGLTLVSGKTYRALDPSPMAKN
jgi:murein DD-endopeptidase MepM/ murein hydrolase activator NlpD